MGISLKVLCLGEKSLGSVLKMTTALKVLISATVFACFCVVSNAQTHLFLRPQTGLEKRIDAAGLQQLLQKLNEMQTVEKRRPSEMSRNGFGANAFSGDFGQFYTMKRSEPEIVDPLLSLVLKK